MYAECVRLCLAPLPTVYFQKSALEVHNWWFGNTKSDCLTCHARGETRNRATGVIMQPELFGAGLSALASFGPLIATRALGDVPRR